MHTVQSECGTGSTILGLGSIETSEGVRIGRGEGKVRGKGKNGGNEKEGRSRMWNVGMMKCVYGERWVKGDVVEIRSSKGGNKDTKRRRIFFFFLIHIKVKVQ